jgi:hypothetical protein
MSLSGFNLECLFSLKFALRQTVMPSALAKSPDKCFLRRCAVRGMKHVAIGMVAAFALCCGLGQSAYAAHGNSGSGSHKVHYKAKKNNNAFGGKYMAPKKQHRPSGYYHSSLTGKTVYGKQ